MALNKKGSFVWHGQRIKRKLERAVARATIAWAMLVSTEAKMDVHRVTGTLSRSIHAAPSNYDGGSDIMLAKASALSGIVGQVPRWLGNRSVAEVAAGSWIDYAKTERQRGGTHDWLSRAVTVADAKFPFILARAMGQEFS